MTSNLGSDIIQKLAEQNNYEVMKQEVMQIVSGHFRPELLNRIDEVVVFHPLEKDQLISIALIQLELLQQRLAEQDLSVTLSKEFEKHLLEVGYDPAYGARPLKRALQRLLENPLAQSLLAGKFMPHDKIEADWKDGKTFFNVKRKAKS